MINIKYIRTLYPHWGKHSGIHQFIRHLPPQKYRSEQKAVPFECASSVGKKFDSLFVKAVKGRGVKAYRLDVLFMPLEAATANNVILEGIACGLPVGFFRAVFRESLSPWRGGHPCKK